MCAMKLLSCVNLVFFNSVKIFSVLLLSSQIFIVLLFGIVRYLSAELPSF